MCIKHFKSLATAAVISLGLFSGLVQAEPIDIKAKLTAVPSSLSTHCPGKINFHGRIYASRPTVVMYRFIRSDGAKSQFKKLLFKTPGVRAVSTSWTIGKSYSGWEAIEVVRPRHIISNRAPFKLHCKNRLTIKPGVIKPGVLIRPRITLVRPYKVCVKRGQRLYIVGKFFGNVPGIRGVAMGGHGKHVDLQIQKWSNTMIIARIPLFAPLQKGKSYYVAIERKNHSKWLSNLYQPITMCP